MKKLWLILLICLIGLPLMGSSCLQPVDKITGGGFIPAGHDCGKANFGFNIQFAYDNSILPCISGQFEYDDHVTILKCGLPVRFHGELTGLTLGIGRTYFAEGTYTTQPPTFDPVTHEKLTGKFCVTVVDNGKPNDADPDDFIKVDIKTGPLAGYSHYGSLQGGNIVVHYVK
jgi:hypothetical protein